MHGACGSALSSHFALVVGPDGRRGGTGDGLVASVAGGGAPPCRSRASGACGGAAPRGRLVWATCPGGDDLRRDLAEDLVGAAGFLALADGRGRA